MLVVIIFEFAELTRQVDRIPEEHSIEIFAANRPDQAFDERVRNRDVRNRTGAIRVKLYEFATHRRPAMIRIEMLRTIILIGGLWIG